MAEFSIVQCSRCGEEVPISACFQEGDPMKVTCSECMGVFADSRDPDDAMMEADECIREWRELNDPDYFEGGDDVQEYGEVHEEEDTSVLGGNKEAEDENL